MKHTKVVICTDKELAVRVDDEDDEGWLVQQVVLDHAQGEWSDVWFVVVFERDDDESEPSEFVPSLDQLTRAVRGVRRYVNEEASGFVVDTVKASQIVEIVLVALGAVRKHEVPE